MNKVKRNVLNITGSHQADYNNIRADPTKLFCQTEEDVPTSSTSNDSIEFQQGANLFHSENTHMTDRDIRTRATLENTIMNHYKINVMKHN